MGAPGAGTSQLFELQVARTEGTQSLVLRRELASFVVPVGGDVAKSKPELVEHVTEATQGPPRVDIAEARRAFEIGRQAANARLVTRWVRFAPSIPATTQSRPWRSRSSHSRGYAQCERESQLLPRQRSSPSTIQGRWRMVRPDHEGRHTFRQRKCI